MAKIKNTNIEFNIGTVGLQLNGKISRKSNGDFSKFESGGSREGQNPDPFINAVEIDWNGAKLGDTIIKMIGESILFNSCSA